MFLLLSGMTVLRSMQTSADLEEEKWEMNYTLGLYL